MKWPGRARSCGSRRARGGRAWVPSAARCGVTAARRTDRNRAIIPIICRARCSWARCAARFRPNCATANCEWCSEFALSEPKTKLMRQALDALEAKRTVLLVDNARQSQSGAFEPQSGRREAGGQPRRECLRSAGARAGAAERSGRAETFGGVWHNAELYTTSSSGPS